MEVIEWIAENGEAVGAALAGVAVAVLGFVRVLRRRRASKEGPQ